MPYPAPPESIATRAFYNTPKSAWGVAQDLGSALLRPDLVAKALYNVAKGGLQKTVPGKDNPYFQNTEDDFEDFIRLLRERFQNPGETFAEDPVGMGLDMVGLMTGIGGLMGRTGLKMQGMLPKDYKHSTYEPLHETRRWEDVKDMTRKVEAGEKIPPFLVEGGQMRTGTHRQTVNDLLARRGRTEQRIPAIQIGDLAPKYQKPMKSPYWDFDHAERMVAEAHRLGRKTTPKGFQYASVEPAVAANMRNHVGEMVSLRRDLGWKKDTRWALRRSHASYDDAGRPAGGLTPHGRHITGDTADARSPAMRKPARHAALVFDSQQVKQGGATQAAKTGRRNVHAVLHGKLLSPDEIPDIKAGDPRWRKINYYPFGRKGKGETMRFYFEDDLTKAQHAEIKKAYASPDKKLSDSTADAIVASGKKLDAYSGHRLVAAGDDLLLERDVAPLMR